MSEPKFSQGEWKQDGVIIWSDCGDNSSKSTVICAMAEPYPQFVEYKPLQINSKGWDMQMANANLIVASKDMYEALKLLQSALTEYQLRDVKKRYSLCVADAAASNALAKAEGR